MGGPREVEATIMLESKVFVLPLVLALRCTLFWTSANMGHIRWGSRELVTTQSSLTEMFWVFLS